MTRGTCSPRRDLESCIETTDLRLFHSAVLCRLAALDDGGGAVVDVVDAQTGYFPLGERSSVRRLPRLSNTRDSQRARRQIGDVEERRLVDLSLANDASRAPGGTLTVGARRLGRLMKLSGMPSVARSSRRLSRPALRRNGPAGPVHAPERSLQEAAVQGLGLLLAMSSSNIDRQPSRRQKHVAQWRGEDMAVCPAREREPLCRSTEERTRRTNESWISRASSTSR